MNTARKLFHHTDEVAASIALCIVVATVVTNAISRYLFNFIFTWAEEVAVIGSVWAALLGASVCYRNRMDICIDALILIMPPSVQRYWKLGVDIFLLVLTATITYLSVTLSISSYSKPTPMLGLPYTYVNLALTVSFGLMVLSTLGFILEDLRAIRSQSNKK